VATDPAGLTDECTFDVTVVDDHAPEITCPANIRQNADAGECEADVTFAATATDNCSYTLAYDIGGRRSPRRTPSRWVRRGCARWRPIRRD